MEGIQGWRFLVIHYNKSFVLLAQRAKLKIMKLVEYNVPLYKDDITHTFVI